MPSTSEDITTRSQTRSPAPLPAGCLAVAAGPDIRANADAIAAGIPAAQRAGVRLLLTPEAALTGYPGGGRDDLEAVDWRSVAAREDELAELACERGVCLILGTGSLGDDGQVCNDALVCGAVDREVRYRKRCLTPGDHEHYAPGDAPVVVEACGWRLGLGICFDLRFPDVWADCALAGADAFCCLAHLAGVDVEAGVRAQVLPAVCAARASEFATPLLLCNTGVVGGWIGSGHWDARGVCVETQAGGLLTTCLRPRQSHPEWYAAIRQQSLARWRARPWAGVGAAG